jgi:hypothetical protein
MFAGAIMMHELLRQPLLNWILPLALLLGLLQLGGIALEVMKAKVGAVLAGEGSLAVAPLFCRLPNALYEIFGIGMYGCCTVAMATAELLRQPLLNCIWIWMQELLSQSSTLFHLLVLPQDSGCRFLTILPLLLLLLLCLQAEASGGTTPPVTSTFRV